MRTYTGLCLFLAGLTISGIVAGQASAEDRAPIRTAVISESLGSVIRTEHSNISIEMGSDGEVFECSFNREPFRKCVGTQFLSVGVQVTFRSQFQIRDGQGNIKTLVIEFNSSNQN